MKVKIVAIITVILILMLYVPVYADTSIPDPPSDTWEYWVVVTDRSSGVVNFICSHNPITVEKGEYRLSLQNHKYYAYSDNDWNFVWERSEHQYFNFGNMLAANHDIAYTDGSGFFFLGPKMPQLYRTMKITDFGTILRNFSGGLIPIIGCLILVISLRKGWEFLRTQLKH